LSEPEVVAVKGKAGVEAAQSGSFAVKIMSRIWKKVLHFLPPLPWVLKLTAHFDYTTETRDRG
jgi:hypothetical protein